MSGTNQVANFLGLEFKGISKEIILAEESTLKLIVTVNADFIVKAKQDHKFLQLINNSYATFDGQVPYLLAKKANPGIAIEKISGSDFIHDICIEAKKKGKKVFLLGGHTESNSLSVEKLKAKYGIEIEGYSPPHASFPFPAELNSTILSKIATFKPDFLLVGFGMMKQELWILENKKVLEANGVRWAIGVGGTFEFVSGKIKRAPKVVQQLGLEWLYRIKKEPRRLLKRYLVSNTYFLWYYMNSLLK